MKPLLAIILRWIASLSWIDFARIAGAAAYAAGFWTKTPEMTESERAEVNASRAAHVRKFITDRFKGVKGNTLNVVLELAVFWFNRTVKK